MLGIFTAASLAPLHLHLHLQSREERRDGQTDRQTVAFNGRSKTIYTTVLSCKQAACCLVPKVFPILVGKMLAHRAKHKTEEEL